MVRSLMCVAVVAMCVTASGTAWANGPPRKIGVVQTPGLQKGHGPVLGHGPVVTGKGGTLVHETVHFGNDYHRTHGTKFSHGYYFRGNEFRHFRYRQWSNHYRTWMFYYPGTHNWYYWSGRNGGFYPMSYAGTVAPNGTLPPGTDSLPNQLPPDQPLPPDQLPPNQMPPVQ